MCTPLVPPAPLSPRVTVLCLEGRADKAQSGPLGEEKAILFFFYKERGIFF